MLAALLLHPDDELSLAEIAARVGVRSTTALRYVRDLTRAGIFARYGDSYRVNLANAAVAPLTQLVAMSYGGIPLIADAFTGIPGVHEVWVYGSWAARYRGEPGPMPRDVDVLVVGTPDRADVYDAADEAERRIGYPVHPVVVTDEAFETAAEPLLREVKTAPRVRVIPPEDTA